MNVGTAGSTSSHGGSFVATGLTTTNGETVLTIGDVFTCPTHGAQTVLTGSVKTRDLNGNYITYEGAVTSCGATIIKSPAISGNTTLQLTG
jgi:uncharacterized Zn-binding protein involved in type VI secretion